MAATVTVRVDGLRELGEAMRKLSADVAKRVAVSATGAAAKVVKTQAVRNVISNESRNATAVFTGSLRDAVIVKKIPKSQTDLTSEHVVTVRGRGKPRGNPKRKQARAPHAIFIEFGTVEQPAEPFLRPAFESEKGRALDVMADKLRQRIAKVTPK